MMKLENIGFVNTHMNNDPRIIKQVLQPETPDKVSISTAQGIEETRKTQINEAIRLDKPPFFPIGDTQAIFKK
jgi:hypothetical protein